MDHSVTLFSVDAHGKPISHCYLSKHSGKLIFTTSPNDVIKMWSIDHNTPVQMYNKEKLIVNGLKANSDESLLLYSTEDHKLNICDIKSSKLIASLFGNKFDYSVFDFLDSKRIVTGLSNSRLQVIDINSKTVITEMIGHQSPLAQIGCFDDTYSFYSIDTSGMIYIWDKRSMSFAKDVFFPSNSSLLPITPSCFAYYYQNAVQYTSLDYQDPYRTIPLSFHPNCLFPSKNQDLFITSNISLYHYSYDQNRLSHLGEVPNVIDIGYAANSFIPVVSVDGPIITVHGMPLHNHATSQSVLSKNDEEVISTIQTNFYASNSMLSHSDTIPSLESSMDETVFLQGGVAVKSSSFLFNTSFASDNDSSIVVSEDSILEMNEPIERKVITPRPSVMTSRTSMPRLSETRLPQSVLPNPRKSIALNSALVNSKPTDRQTLPNPLLPRQSKVVSPAKPASYTVPIVEKKGLSPTRPIVGKANELDSQRMDEPSSQSIINVLTMRKELFHAIQILISNPLGKPEILRLLKSSEDVTVIGTCLKEYASVLTPSSLEELAEISPLINICLNSKIETIMLNALRFLQRTLVLVKDLPRFENNPMITNELGCLEMTLFNLENGSIQNVLIQVYITECSTLLGYF